MNYLESLAKNSPEYRRVASLRDDYLKEALRLEEESIRLRAEAFAMPDGYERSAVMREAMWAGHEALKQLSFSERAERLGG